MSDSFAWIGILLAATERSLDRYVAVRYDAQLVRFVPAMFADTTSRRLAPVIREQSPFHLFLVRNRTLGRLSCSVGIKTFHPMSEVRNRLLRLLPRDELEHVMLLSEEVPRQNARFFTAMAFACSTSIS